MRHMPSFNPIFGVLSGLLGLALGLAFLIGITCLIVALVKRRRRDAGAAPGAGPAGPWRGGPGPWGPGPWHHHHGPRPPFEALHILDERLARSEIDVDDYLTRRTVLLGDRPNGTEYKPGDAPEPPHPPTPGPVPPTPEAPPPPDEPGRRLDSDEE